MGFLNKLFPKRPPKSAMKLGRNDRCWCGSGRKYKKCHYDSDQKHFSRLRTATCRASS